MFLSHEDNIEKKEYNGENLKNVIKQSLVGPKEGWDGYVMRVFTLLKDGFTPRHSHPWPHINYIVSGEGTVYLSSQEYEVTPGSTVYIPSNTVHQFMANKNSNLKFICIVPEKGDK